MTSFSSVKNWSVPYPSVSTAYLKLPSIVGNTAMTVPTSWSSAALSTFSPIANFDIENSFWNHRHDYNSQFGRSLLNHLPSRISVAAVVIMPQLSSPAAQLHGTVKKAAGIYAL